MTKKPLCFQLETGIDTIQVIKEAYTYVNIIPSPLHVVLLDGSPTKVSRGIMFPRVFCYLFTIFIFIQLHLFTGWGQSLTLRPMDLCLDPDEPEDRVKKKIDYFR